LLTNTHSTTIKTYDFHIIYNNNSSNKSKNKQINESKFKKQTKQVNGSETVMDIISYFEWNWRWTLENINRIIYEKVGTSSNRRNRMKYLQIDRKPKRQARDICNIGHTERRHTKQI